MGNQTPAVQNHDKIEKLINSSRFSESYLLLKNQMLRYPSLSNELDKLKKTEDTYRYMLDFIFEGHSDPSQKEMKEQLRDSLHRANDLLLRESRLTDSSDIYSSVRRMFNHRKISFQELLDDFKLIFKEDKQNPVNDYLSSRQSFSIGEIFNFVWTIIGSESHDYESVSNALTDAEIPEYLKALIISAIILGNTSYFDSDSFEILLNLNDSDISDKLRARVIAGIVLISLLHPTRIAGNITMRSRLMLLADDNDLKNLINDTVLNIVRTYDTNRVDNKMRNEVIPGLMKIKPDILDKMKNTLSDSEKFLMDENPKWEEILENSGIGDKIKEINDLQMEGADVMVTAFSNLKGFPFFNPVANWFIPFLPNHHEFASLQLSNDEEIVNRFTMVMCDSDLHSFLLSLKSMPEDKRINMFSNMNNQMKEAQEAFSNSIGETNIRKLKREIRRTLQDIYRFFKFYRKKDEFEDPFEKAFTMDNLEPLLLILGINEEMIQLVGEFYFKNKYYQDAIGFLEYSNLLQQDDFNLWEKIGFAYDRLRNFDKAIEWYHKAEIINPDNSWLEKKLAVALKNSGQHKEALEYYEKALRKDPENFHLLMSAAQCHLETGNYSEALQLLHHANYLKADSISALRALAWTELISGNLEKATLQYDKILQYPEVEKNDFLNAAHAKMAEGDLKKALELYKLFLGKTDTKDITELVIAFKNDSDLIKKIGIKTADLRLVVDKIRYDIFV